MNHVTQIRMLRDGPTLFPFECDDVARDCIFELNSECNRLEGERDAARADRDWWRVENIALRSALQTETDRNKLLSGLWTALVITFLGYVALRALGWV